MPNYYLKKVISMTKEQELYDAAKSGYINRVNEILEAKGVDINRSNSKYAFQLGHTALYAAAGNGHLDVVKLLIKYDADPALGQPDDNALTHAAKENRLTIIRYFARIMGRLARDKGYLFKNTHLLKSAVVNNAPDVFIFLHQNNAATCHSISHLALACQKGFRRIVDYLLEQQSNDINDMSVGDASPLMLACVGGHLDIVDSLIRSGASVDAKNRHGYSALTKACMTTKNIDVINRLLVEGADINQRANDGVTPLLQACLFNSLDVVEHLIAVGANVHQVNTISRSSEPCLKDFTVCDYIKWKHEQVSSPHDLRYVQQRQQKYDDLLRILSPANPVESHAGNPHGFLFSVPQSLSDEPEQKETLIRLNP